MNSDQRKYKRLPLSLKLEVSKLYNQSEMIPNLDALFDITDISKSGLGFNSNEKLPLNYYFNATLNLGSDENVLKVVIKIIRSMPMENGLTNYGCEIVALPTILEGIIDNYEDDMSETK